MYPKMFRINKVNCRFELLKNKIITVNKKELKAY